MNFQAGAPTMPHKIRGNYTILSEKTQSNCKTSVTGYNLDLPQQKGLYIVAMGHSVHMAQQNCLFWHSVKI